MKCRWQKGDRIMLLENDNQYHPVLFAVIGRANRQVTLELFVWFKDGVGWRLHAVPLKAVRRGIQMEVPLDGYGLPGLDDEFVSELIAAGVIFRYYDPRPKLTRMCINLFRWMYRKIVVIDDTTASVGGINHSAEYMSDHGPEAKQDYTVQVEGSVVLDTLQFELENLPSSETAHHWWHHCRHQPGIDQTPGETQTLFIWRDSQDHRDDIERHYLRMLIGTRREMIVVNAYFFSGYRLLHVMCNTTRCGMRAELIVRGESDTPIVKSSTHLLYHYLVKGGVQIYECRRRPPHGKVTLANDRWTIVGSSNLDPLGLSLNLEANLIIHDQVLNQMLRNNLNGFIARDYQRINKAVLPKRNWWRLGVSVITFHFLRCFPAWVSWLPVHTPRLARVSLPVQPETETQDRVDSQTRDNLL